MVGQLYTASAPEIQADQAAARESTQRFNVNFDRQLAERYHLLRDRFAAIGADSKVCPPFLFDYGYNNKLGAGIFLNCGCAILDVASVEIGETNRLRNACKSLPLTIPETQGYD